ncbi:MAG TPA: 2-C-methyl-D-erythritol 2,4-cyclodiphosphate synthase [Oscillospiraceae bacterium]|nr:2-C-methyl-D-erythritol 2,4-cyclodiphosphate synthase [Oscillospiraceae bacterium]HNW04422.1 2-C-methyl-D-erythritol 2,4-cyclodiphosphate synthase [Oscillospiraceae bacterium]
MRIGHGYDAHRLVPGRKLILGGVEIPFALGLLGHSDADALAHAVTDALFGAAGLPDIGAHFPDTDPAYEGADSMLMLKEAAAEVAALGLRVENIDCTLVADRPKLSPDLPRMRENLALALGVAPERVNVKATTEEGLGLAGEGIGAHCVALLREEP